MISKKPVIMVALTLLMLFSGLFLSSCAASRYSSYDEATVDYVVEGEYAPAPEAAYDMASSEAGAPEVKRINGGVGESPLRHVIRNGSIDLTVRNTRDTMREIQEMVKDLDGLVSNSYIYEIREGQYGGQMTLRVPERLFDSVMEQLETYGKTANVQTSVDDVTMQYVDLESRLKNQKAQEERLIEILDMAETVEEVLEVERELFRVRGDIESMTAQLTQLSDQVSFATINLSLREESIPTESISGGPFDNFGERIKQALVGSINFLLNAVSVIVIIIVSIIPILFGLGLIALLIWLLVRKASRKKELAESEDKEETS